MNLIKETIQGDRWFGKIFDYIIQALIFLSLILLAVETLPDLTAKQKDVLDFIELVIVLVFSLEYLLRLYAASKKFKFIFSFLGIVDLLAILPFYLVGFDLKAIRFVRLFRIVRLLKLTRYSTALERIYRALVLAKEELLLFLSSLFLLLYLASIGIYYFENKVQPEVFSSVFESFWWATITLTTVGYGDVVPITLGGRCFTMLFLIVGLGVIAAPTGLLASAMNTARAEEKEKQEQSKQLAKAPKNK